MLHQEVVSFKEESEKWHIVFKCSATAPRKTFFGTKYFTSLSIRWYRDYLLQLRTANTDEIEGHRSIGVNEATIHFKEYNVFCINQDLARVLERRAGRDGATGTNIIKFSYVYVTRRAVQLLCLLEVG